MRHGCVVFEINCKEMSDEILVVVFNPGDTIEKCRGPMSVMTATCSEAQTSAAAEEIHKIYKKIMFFLLKKYYQAIFFFE